MRMTHKMTRDRNNTTSAKPRNQAVSIPVCCKHFFPIGETSGDTISDVAGNVVITDVGKFVWDATLGSAQRTQLGTTALASGAWADTNEKDFIMLGVGTAVDDSVVANIHTIAIGRTGSAAQNGIIVSHQNASIRGDDDANVTTPDLNTTLVDGLSLSMANIADRSGELTYRVKGDLDQSVTASITEVTGFTPAAYFDSLGMKLQGLALFVFEDGIPSDHETAIDWMYANWTGTTNGTLRQIYPPWMGLV